jgi:DNA-binding NtrC family response regulator
LSLNNAILLVDDDPAVRGMLGFSLESAGYQVLEAGSRTQAIDALKADTVAVVLLDMGMPPNEHTPQEGIAVLEWLNFHQPQVNTIVLTGQNADATSYQALKYGAFDFLEKPVDMATVTSALNRALLFYDQACKLKSQEGLQKVQVDAALGEGVKSIRNQAEEKLVRQVLTDTGFNVHEAARRLGVKRENVYYLINKYGLQRTGGSDGSL